MKISSRGRYAVRVMTELAQNPNKLFSVAELSAVQNISTKYLEKIISLLTKANLIESTRGALGGYKLTKKPNEYSIAEILSSTKDLPELAPCLCKENSCPQKESCSSINCWEKLNLIILDYLKGVSLQNLIDKKI